MWFIVAAIVGVVIGVAVMYKPAPTPLDDAIALIRANKHAAALPILEDIARKQPEDAEVFPWLAQCYLITDRLAEGRTALDTALKLKISGALTGPVVLSYADYYERKEDYAEAERLFASAQTAVPEKDLVAGKAQLYSRWADADSDGEKPELALKHLQAAYELLPDGDEQKAPIPHKIGNLYRQLAAVAETEQNDDNKAVSLLESSLKWADEPATRMALGSIYLRENRVDDAIQSYKAVCEQDSNNLEARHHLVDLYMQKKDPQGAQQALFELTEKERSVENFQTLASLSLQLRDYASAVRALEDAIVLKPKDVPLLEQLRNSLFAWYDDLSKQGKSEEATSVKGHADRVSDLLKSIQGETAKELNGGEKELAPGALPVSLVASRMWLAKGSFTPEGEIRFKNTSGKPVTDLAFSVVFYDNTTRRKYGSVTVTAASDSHPLAPGAVQSAYFSCPTIVKAEHQLAVIILWKGHFLKELPVVKER